MGNINFRALPFWQSAEYYALQAARHVGTEMEFGNRLFSRWSAEIARGIERRDALLRSSTEEDRAENSGDIGQ